MVVLLLTFLCYTAYHASRKPPSIVKSVLHGDSSTDENGGCCPHAAVAMLSFSPASAAQQCSVSLLGATRRQQRGREQ